MSVKVQHANAFVDPFVNNGLEALVDIPAGQTLHMVGYQIEVVNGNWNVRSDQDPKNSILVRSFGGFPFGRDATIDTPMMSIEGPATLEVVLASGGTEGQFHCTYFLERTNG